MKTFKDSLVEKWRYQGDGMKSPPGAQFGTFIVPLTIRSGSKPVAIAICMADDGSETGWERVTIELQEKRRAHVQARAPKLSELESIKRLFWEDHETAFWFLHADEDRKAMKFPHRVTIWKRRGEPTAVPPQESLG